MEKIHIVVVGDKHCGKHTIVKKILSENEPLDPNSPAKSPKAKKTYNLKPANLTKNIAKKENHNDLSITTLSLHTADRKFIFIIPSGYQQLLKYTITTPTAPDVAILVIDASKPLNSEIYHYAYLLVMFGIKKFIVAVNKMDLKKFDRIFFWEFSGEVIDLLKKQGAEIIDTIPISALKGDNLKNPSTKTTWHSSPTLVEQIKNLDKTQNPARLPLRFLVKCRYIEKNKTKILGLIATGKIFQGHKLTFAPTHHSTKVISIEVENQHLHSAQASQYVGLYLENTNHLHKGQVGFNVCQPPLITDSLNARLLWNNNETINTSDKVEVLCAYNVRRGKIKYISKVTDPTSSKQIKPNNQKISKLKIADVRIQLKTPICADPFDHIPQLGKFVLIKNNQIKAGGIIK